MPGKKVFVTVGTTRFSKLIAKVSSDDILKVLHNLGYNLVQFQVGSSSYEVKEFPGITLKYDKYFSDFQEEINESDLVISHAGAGTCLEVLRSKKPLIIVINEDLMDNHQTELAEQLANEGFLYYCTPETLEETLKKDLTKLKPYPKVDKTLFSRYLDTCMGFS